MDTIINRYKRQDEQNAKEQARMQLGTDSRGGIDAISGTSIAHNKPEDNKELSELMEQFSTGGKGPDGMPNGERILTKS